MNLNAAFQWTCHKKAEELVQSILEAVAQRNPMVESLSSDLLRVTSTRLFDWLDHVSINDSPSFNHDLLACGFIVASIAPTYRVFYHPGAQLPRIVVFNRDGPSIGISVLVDSIADFLMVRGMIGHIEGSLLSGYRRCCVSTTNQAELWVVERRGFTLMEPVITNSHDLEKYLLAKEKWMTRPRRLKDDEAMFREAISLAEEMVSSLGVSTAACLVLECERSYWQSRNIAGQIQKNRQDRLGMGWSNHDHHTFRSSRLHFNTLVRLFEILGFHCRERFYAGEEAGWGAQVMENPSAHLVLFLDVDLLPNELNIDFSHQPLLPIEQVGTIGLWCALHGDSILKAGMHHLEAQFMFEELKDDLKTKGIAMMEPFSAFPYLKQAFTMGEIWDVDPQHIESLVKSGKITAMQGEKFLREGVIGSHLENLQRREGFKGFNQKNVSLIIKETDPRHHHQ